MRTTSTASHREVVHGATGDLYLNLRSGRPPHLEWSIHWLFRLALFCEFVGHGAFGVLTKPPGCPILGHVRASRSVGLEAHAHRRERGYRLRDAALVAPIRAGLLYMACWGLFTALLRPLAGEGWWEFLERSYNFGVPLLMLWVHGFGTPCRLLVCRHHRGAALHRATGATVLNGRCAASWPACSSAMVASGW